MTMFVPAATSFTSSMQSRRLQFNFGHTFSVCPDSHLSQFIPSVQENQFQPTSEFASGVELNQKLMVVQLQKLLLLYEHTNVCMKDCGEPRCRLMKQKVYHILNCNYECTSVCQSYKKIFGHYFGCMASYCPVCPAVRRKMVYLQTNYAKRRKMNHDQCPPSDSGIPQDRVTEHINIAPQTSIPPSPDARITFNPDVNSFESWNWKDLPDSPVIPFQSLSNEEEMQLGVKPTCKEVTEDQGPNFCLKQNIGDFNSLGSLSPEDQVCLNQEVIEDHGCLFSLQHNSDKDALEILEMEELNGNNNDFHELHGEMNGENPGQVITTYQTFYSDEIEDLREPLPVRKLYEAKELQRTKMSDHIEQRIFASLKEERQKRATILGLDINKVPTAENLIVRVVSSVDKTVEVNPQFREIFQEGIYPAEYTYKSKVVVLLQIIDGSAVILFVMYVQEQDSDCSEPTKKRVNISYIDSVKYFTPEIKTVTGEALRTFVYHEFLVGYLDYCKKRYFTSCHIWSSPPSKNDDYILYCHPKHQKTPKSDKLRQWYYKMILKASLENVVVEHTNLYDHFFSEKSEIQANITTGSLPYFDGDFLSDEINWLFQKGNEKFLANNGTARERMLRAARRDASSVANEKLLLLMKKLGEIINPMKKDFMILHLYPICKSCYQPIINGEQWVCNTCKAYQFCARCHAFEELLHHNDKHPSNADKKHSFHKVDLEELGGITDEEESIQNDIFESRLKFLDFCRNNNYQFDTLQQAQNSTKMVLTYLHNPPAQCD